MTTVASPLTGRIVPLEDVADEVFAERIMGDGVAIAPTEGAVVAPVTGTIEKLFPGGHGIALQTADGLQVLVHIGLETVHLKGDGFTVHAAQGDTVAVGDPLVTVDLARLAELEIDTTSPVIVISGEPASVVAGDQVTGGQPLLEV